MVSKLKLKKLNIVKLSESLLILIQTKLITRDVPKMFQNYLVINGKMMLENFCLARSEHQQLIDKVKCVYMINKYKK